jgi:tyrosinase
MPITALPVRRSILEIQTAFNDETDTRTLENLMTAWAGIQALAPTDPNSFFVIGGYHGEPFRGAGYGNSQWWGGWCNHGNVLFPTWHRAYLHRLEKALQSIPGCEDVMLPYWDETDSYSLANGIPSCLTDETFTYKSTGKTIPNPLCSFTFPLPITDNVSSDNGLYTKPFIPAPPVAPVPYTTVRYPYSGLVGTQAAQEQTTTHNSQWPSLAEGNVVLNQNIVNWLNLAVVTIAPDGVNSDVPTTIPAGILSAFQSCLNAPNYTVFSNVTSAQNYNDLLPTGATQVVPLEQPHNDIHLAVGGCDVTSVPGGPGFSGSNFDASPIVGANGDMGENDTAGLDPIFFFHHCNVDRMFWAWQKKTGNTNQLEIIPQYPGTNSVDSQGPTPGVSGNVWLDMDSPLMPFVKSNGDVFASKDVVNIETQLNYTYSIGSLDKVDWGQSKDLKASPETGRTRLLQVSGISKGAISGSFVVAAHANVKGKKHLVGVRSVLSRHAIQGCANCQTHLNVKAHFDLGHIHDSVLSDPGVTFSAEIIGHKGPSVAAAVPSKPLKVAVR